MHVNDEARQSIMLSLFRSRRQVLRVTLSSALTRSRILSLLTKESRSRRRQERSEKRPRESENVEKRSTEAGKRCG